MLLSRKGILVLLLSVSAFILASYPFISNWFVENSANSIVAAVDEKIKMQDGTDIQEQIKAARLYNERMSSIRVNLTDPFDESAMGADTPDYASTLKMTDDGVMGYIQIPPIDVNLPIYHGTSSAVLEHGVGHLEGTSLPIGGESTHSVLTGHTGLSSARLFTDLTELENGDVFILSVMGEKIAYKVDMIKIVEPDNLKDLYIVNGKDYCTLVTCTPYGINSHRLLVRGERTDYEEAVADDDTLKKRDIKSSWMREYQESLLISIAIFLPCIILILIVKNIKGKNRR